MPKDQFLLVLGNPLYGFNFIGPFDDAEEAIIHGEKFFDDEQWWIAAMCPVAESVVN